MTTRVRERPATYEDLLKVPDHLVAELIDGELLTAPRPSIPHADAVSELVAILRSAFGRRGNRMWHILVEPELHLAGNVLIPDIAGWRVDHVGPVLPRTAALTIVPDWVCEAISGSTERIDRQKKLPIYASVGVPHAWLLDAERQWIEVKRLENGRWNDIAVHARNAKARMEPFEELEIDLSDLWGGLPS